MALLKRVGQEPECALPGAVQKVQSPVHSLPVREMIERVAERLAVAALQDVLRRQDQRLHLQQIFGHVGIELHGPMYRLHCRHLGLGQAPLTRHVRRELVRHGAGLEQRGGVADGGRLGQRDVIVLGENGLHVRVVAHLEQTLQQVLVDV